MVRITKKFKNDLANTYVFTTSDGYFVKVNKGIERVLNEKELNFFASISCKKSRIELIVGKNLTLNEILKINKSCVIQQSRNAISKGGGNYEHPSLSKKLYS